MNYLATNHEDLSPYPPVLSQLEEYRLALDLFNNNTIDSAKTLIMSQMRFVSFIAKEYSSYGLDHNDLVQSGSIGLMNAVKKFNPHKKTRLSSFAVYWIRSEIHEFIFKNWRIVKIATTKQQRKLFFKMSRFLSGNPTSLASPKLKSISSELSVSEKVVVEMETRLRTHSVCQDEADNIKTTRSPEDIEIMASDNLNAKIQVNDFIKSLSKKDADIIVSRYLTEQKQTLKELAIKYEVSSESIRKKEKSLFAEFRRFLK